MNCYAYTEINYAETQNHCTTSTIGDSNRRKHGALLAAV